MRIFASHTQQTIPIPFDVPHTVTVRKLTGREVEQAQEADAMGIAMGGTRTWATKLRHLLEKGPSDQEVLKALADPLLGFDRFSVIRSGLLAWSYPLPITRSEQTATGTTAAVVTDAIEDLDDEAADFIATEILKLTKPGLFLTPEQREGAIKND